MIHLKTILTVVLLSTTTAVTALGAEKAAGTSPDAGRIVTDAFNYMRGLASISRVDMTIHRPDWRREMTMKAWTLGTAESLFTIISPPRDEGNGTLKKGREMWMYNPKVNRVIKIPPSMMAQAWMGSDFSNNDLAKSDSLLNDYTHRLDGTETHEGQTVYRITSTPKPGAPVVWGRQTLKIRADHIFLEQTFFDEDLEPVKSMTTREIKKFGDRLFPSVWRMKKIDPESGSADEYTELVYRELEFKTSLPDRVFTLSNLKAPKQPGR